ncbi:lysozyme inhibitor LprI family protein [Caulobacter sp. DWR1-3-2b1]|uniref:lysozyme inhibitor LprI family protein n=1 Tax=Caulobacter sp. DWR1-3-2b1 TaxID=2804670 RepID=UPI003CF42854
MRPKTLSLVLALTPILLMGIAGSASAASFDCKKARAADEKAICAERALNDKDVRMTELYGINKRTLAMGGRGALQDQQRDWLRDRKACGSNKACLNRAYDRRLGDLEKSMERIYQNAPF